MLSLSFRDIIKEILQFYNDKRDMFNIRIKKSRKSRKKKHDTNEQDQQQIVKWETFLPHEVEIKSKGNNMTCLLLIYVKEIHEC